jgi:hypothetical protein
MPGPIGFEIEIATGNALKYKADVLAIKYSQSWTTMTQSIIKNLPDDSVLIERPPRPGEWLLVDADGAVAATQILLIGTPSRKQYSYSSMHDLAQTALKALHETQTDPPVKHIALTVSGLGWGFDEAESLKAVVLGLRAAVEAGTFPRTLERVTIVESQAKRAEVLTTALKDLLDHHHDLGGNDMVSERALPPPPLVISPENPAPEVETPTLNDDFIFVAMPFANKYKDAFYVAIQPAVKELGLQCIRLDESSYTGDVMETIKQRIRDSQLVVALLDGSNPNVYLEIGFAWGVNKPTVLIINQEMVDMIPFDVRGQRYIPYDSLIDLKPVLNGELKAVLEEERRKKRRAANQEVMT